MQFLRDRSRYITVAFLTFAGGATDCGRVGYTEADGAIGDVAAADTPAADVPRVDAQPDTASGADASTIAPGGSCVGSTSSCAGGSGCFAFSGGASICSDCGHYGQRGCTSGAACLEGVLDAAIDMCVYATPSSAPGQPGGSCTRNSDCGSPGQCYQSLCNACGTIGLACCCTASSCSCVTGSCLTGSANNWTVCH